MDTAVKTNWWKNQAIRTILNAWDVSLQPIIYALIQLVGVDESLKILPTFISESQAIGTVKMGIELLNWWKNIQLTIAPDLQTSLYALLAVKLFDWKSEQSVYKETEFLPKFRPFKDNLNMVKLMDLPCNDFINTAYYYGLLANAAYNDEDIELLEQQWNSGTIKWMQPLLKTVDANILRPRFYYFYDHHMETIVLIVRGTHGFSDILSDAVIKKMNLADTVKDEFYASQKPVKFDSPKQAAQFARWEVIQALNQNDCNKNALSLINADAEHTAHSGFMLSARNIIYDPCAPFLAVYDRVKNMTNEYLPRVRVVGHSLGAATAACIVYMLKQLLPESDIRGICFAPPPCFSHMLYYDLQNILKNSIVTFVNRWDIVPRAEPGILKRSVELTMDYNRYTALEKKARDEVMVNYRNKADTVKNEFTQRWYNVIAENRYPKALGALVVPGKCYWLYYHRDDDGQSVIGLYNVIDVNFFNILPPVYFEDTAVISLPTKKSDPEQYTALTDHSMTNYLLHLHYTTLLTPKK